MKNIERLQSLTTEMFFNEIDKTFVKCGSKIYEHIDWLAYLNSNDKNVDHFIIGRKAIIEEGSSWNNRSKKDILVFNKRNIFDAPYYDVYVLEDKNVLSVPAAQVKFNEDF